jgi:AcrR family transcriptional regulator
LKPTTTSRPGRPRDPHLDDAILRAAERLLRERGYANMSIEAVAALAGTTVPSVRRRYPGKAALALAVVDSLRVDPLTLGDGPPRERALAILENFGRNLRRPDSIALLATLLSEESRTPELMRRFRDRLAGPRRRALREALELGVKEGQLPAELDPDAAENMLIGAFYARYVGTGSIPRNWARRVLGQIWPPG